MHKFTPSYISLYESGELQKRVETALSMMSSCYLCPRTCRVNRLNNSKKGVCKTGRYAVVSSYTTHFGEEPSISGSKGSGTIFFGYCNLRCKFCQNHQISQPTNEKTVGREIDANELANIMLSLQNLGCHNINLVSPSHVVAQILEALILAIQNGLKIPIVYNTNAYDSLYSLKLLDGVVDIYLPDFKYLNPSYAAKYSAAKDYPTVAKFAIKEMWQQVGAPKFDENGILQRGLVIRHLVLPNQRSNSKQVLQWIAKNLGTNVYISLMSQYFPTHRAIQDADINRPITEREYDEILDICIELGLENGWFQEFSASEYYRPDFENKTKPFADIDDFL